jgi:hypothetical protein
MQIKMTLRFHHTWSEWLSSRKSTTNTGEDAKKNNLYTWMVGMYISAATVEISMDVP